MTFDCTMLASLKCDDGVQVFMYMQGGCYGIRVQQMQRRVDERWYWDFMQASDAFEALVSRLCPIQLTYSTLYDKIYDEEREDNAEYDDDYDDDDD